MCSLASGLRWPTLEQRSSGRSRMLGSSRAGQMLKTATACPGRRSLLRLRRPSAWVRQQAPADLPCGNASVRSSRPARLPCLCRLLCRCLGLSYPSCKPRPTFSATCAAEHQVLAHDVTRTCKETLSMWSSEFLSSCVLPFVPLWRHLCQQLPCPSLLLLSQHCQQLPCPSLLLLSQHCQQPGCHRCQCASA